MESSIRNLLTASIELKRRVLADPQFVSVVAEVAARMKEVVARNGTIYCAGNGGSTCDAMHLVEELVARFKRERPGIRAHHLCDASVITCWSNDYEFAGVFERQVKTFCTSNDLLVVFSTSGNSANILRAVDAAKELGCETVALTGKDGGAVRGRVDHSVIVPSNDTERIQEVHLMLIHIFCELIEGES